MQYEVVLSKKAFKELAIALEWYNECEEGLGLRFLEAVNDRIELISKTPDMFSLKASGFNEVAVRKFPFIIVYRIHFQSKKVRVLHVFHTSRNPELKK